MLHALQVHQVSFELSDAPGVPLVSEVVVDLVAKPRVGVGTAPAMGLVEVRKAVTVCHHVEVRGPFELRGAWLELNGPGHDAPSVIIVLSDVVDLGGGRARTLEPLKGLSDGVEERTLLHIFEASNVSKGPLCIVPMPLLPIAFHGEWDPIGVTNDLPSGK